MSSVLSNGDYNRMNFMHTDVLVNVVVDVNSSQLHQFRHASELTKEAKGGYLKGSIRVPKFDDHRIVKIVLKLVDNNEGKVHPNVLHITPNERKVRQQNNCRTQEVKRMMSSQDCYVELIFRDSKVWVKHSYFQDCVLDNEGYLDVSDCWDPVNHVLTLGINSLQLTIVKPKQKGKPTPEDDLYISRVLARKCQDIPGKHDLPTLEKEFTSTRGGNNEKESSLFKAYFMADVYFEDDVNPMSGISAIPIYDKGKYELKVDRICPPIICNSGKHEITAMMEKNTGEIPVVFRLIDDNGDDITEPISKMKKVGNCYHFIFDSVSSVGVFDLEVSIKDGDNIVRANDEDQTISLQIWEHNKENCFPCQQSKLMMSSGVGKRKNVESSQSFSGTTPKRRTSSRFTSVTSTSTNSPVSDDNTRTMWNTVDRQNPGFINQRFVLSPDLLSPDSGVGLNTGYNFMNSPQKVFPSAVDVKNFVFGLDASRQDNEVQQLFPTQIPQIQNNNQNQSQISQITHQIQLPTPTQKSDLDDLDDILSQASSLSPTEVSKILGFENINEDEQVLTSSDPVEGLSLATILYNDEDSDEAMANPNLNPMLASQPFAPLTSSDLTTGLDIDDQIQAHLMQSDEQLFEEESSDDNSMQIFHINFVGAEAEDFGPRRLEPQAAFEPEAAFEPAMPMQRLAYSRMHVESQEVSRSELAYMPESFSIGNQNAVARQDRSTRRFALEQMERNAAAAAQAASTSGRTVAEISSVVVRAAPTSSRNLAKPSSEEEQTAPGTVVLEARQLQFSSLIVEEIHGQDVAKDIQADSTSMDELTDLDDDLFLEGLDQDEIERTIAFDGARREIREDESSMESIRRVQPVGRRTEVAQQFQSRPLGSYTKSVYRGGDSYFDWKGFAILFAIFFCILAVLIARLYF